MNPDIPLDQTRRAGGSVSRRSSPQFWAFTSPGRSVPRMLSAWWTGLAASTRRSIAVTFLDGCLIAYGTVLAASFLAGAFLMLPTDCAGGSSARVRRPVAARVLLLCASTLLALGLLEISSWALIDQALGRVSDPPRLRSRFPLLRARMAL